MKQAILTIKNMDRGELLGRIKVLVFYGFLVTLPFIYFAERYVVAIDDQKVTSLDYRVFLIDTYSNKVGMGEYVAYDSLHPISKEKMMVTKRVAGVEGDVVSFNKYGDVFINNIKIKTINPILLQKLGVPLDSLLTKYTLSNGQLFVVGTNPRSYDSSYHGPIKITDLKGISYPLFNY